MDEFIRFLYFLESITIFRILIELIVTLVNFGYLLVKYVIPMMVLILMYTNCQIAYNSALWKSRFTWGTANQTFLNSVKFLSLPNNLENAQTKNFIFSFTNISAPSLQ